MKRIILFCLVIAWSSAASAQDMQRLSAEVLWNLSRLAPPVISPKGGQVVVAATTYPESEEPETNFEPETRLWLLSTEAGHQQRPLTAAGGQANDPVFSPDGKHLAFVGKRNDDENGQIYLLPMDAPGEAIQLTDVPTGASAPSPKETKCASLSPAVPVSWGPPWQIGLPEITTTCASWTT